MAGNMNADSGRIPTTSRFLDTIDLVAQYLKDTGNGKTLATLTACSKDQRKSTAHILYRHVGITKPRWLYYFKARKAVPGFWQHVEFINLKGSSHAWFWESVISGKADHETLAGAIHRLFPRLKAIYHKGTTINSSNQPIYSLWISDRNVCQGEYTNVWTFLLPIVYPTADNMHTSPDSPGRSFPSSLVSGYQLVDISPTSIWYPMQQFRERLTALEQGRPVPLEPRPEWEFEEDARIESWEDVCFAEVRLLTHPDEDVADRSGRAMRIFYLYRQLVKTCMNFDFKLTPHEFDGLDAWLETIEECAVVGPKTAPWDLVVWFNYPIRLLDWTRLCLAFQTDMIARFAALRAAKTPSTVLPHRIDLKTPSDPTRPIPNCLHLVLRLGPGHDARYAEINYCVPERMIDQVYFNGELIRSTA